VKIADGLKKYVVAESYTKGEIRFDFLIRVMI
jgi:hypothetical protein